MNPSNNLAPAFDINKYMNVPGVTPKEVKEIKEAFDLLDESGDGSVDISELKAAVVSLGLSVDSNTLNDIMSTKELDFDAFFKLMTEKVTTNESAEEIMKIFMLFDSEKKGTIGINDLRNVANQLGETLETRQLEEMMSLLDNDGDNEITPENFYLIMTKGAEARERKALLEAARQAKGLASNKK